MASKLRCRELVEQRDDYKVNAYKMELTESYRLEKAQDGLEQ